ncbi:MAG: tRNA lysidine(34) synthetase TilS [Cyanobacteria bacterium P01_A01_bin.114]
MKTWSHTHARLHTHLRASDFLLPHSCSILIAVSGGQDSLCLARLLIDLQPKWGWQLALVHCNHGWRDDAAANAEHVQGLAQQWQLPCFIETAATPPTSEASARRWRYQVFEALARQHGFTHVATGHTATDRAETVLYNLLRGSGLEGLQSLPWQRLLSPSGANIRANAGADILVTRPLLNLTRQDTKAFCEAMNLPIWEDSTNQDLTYRRNRIRQELMPYLRSHFNPQVERTLAHTAELLTAEVDYLEAETDRLYANLVQHDGKNWRIDQTEFRQTPLALRRRLARRVLLAALPESPQFEHVEKLVKLAEGPNRSQTDPFPGGVIAKVMEGVVVIGDW